MEPPVLEVERKCRAMKRFRLQIPRTLWDEMIAHARASAPLECVGLLVGSADGVVKDRYPLINALASPAAFESDPRSMLEAEKRRRAAGWDWLAVYHSHPTSAAIPSRKDVEQHLAAEVVCLIISLAGPDAVIAGYWMLPAGFEQATVDCVA